MSVMGTTVMTTVRKMVIIMVARRTRRNESDWEYLDVEEVRVNLILIFGEFANCTVLVKSRSSSFQHVPINSNAAVYTIVVPTNVFTYIEISLYAQWFPVSFGQTCGHLQGVKMQRMDILMIRNWSYITLEQMHMHTMAGIKNHSLKYIK